MKTHYSSEADALYVRLRPGKVDYTEPLDGDDNRLIDYAQDGSALGVEILDASQGVLLTGLPEAERVARAAAQFNLPVSAPA